MIELPTPQDIEIMAIRAGITVPDACREANLSPAVFHRWKRGKSSPTIKSLKALINVLQVRLSQPQE